MDGKSSSSISGVCSRGRGVWIYGRPLVEEVPLRGTELVKIQPRGDNQHQLARSNAAGIGNISESCKAWQRCEDQFVGPMRVTRS